MEDRFVQLTPNYPKDARYENISFKHQTFSIPIDRSVRIYCDGIFDMFHYGHARLFEQVKGLFPNVCLIVGVCNDQLTTMYKGNVVMNESERYESVRMCKYVDEVIEDAPWVTDVEFLQKHKIDFVAHDEAPYACVGTDDVYGYLKAMNRFIPTKRAASISTTGIITRIIKNYDLYLRRQILRGISYKDLNISLFKKERIMLKESFKKDVKEMKEEFLVALNFWENLSKKFIRSLKDRMEDKHPGMLSKVLNLMKSSESKKAIK